MTATLALGTMNFGRRTPAAEARRIIDVALERGVTHLDTANLYCDGESERLVGQALKGRREVARVTTKVGVWKQEGLSKARVVAALDESLQRLGFDFVETYLLHAPDPKTPIEETLDGVAEVLRSGKTKAWGVSNYASWQVLELMQLAKSRGLPAPVESQLLYNLAVRQLDVEYFAFTRRFPIRTTIFNPLAGGLFARPLQTPRTKAMRLESNPIYKRRYGSDAVLDFAKALTDLAAEFGLTLLQLSYAWVAQRPGVDVVLTGPATEGHLLDAVDAMTREVPPALLTRIDAAHRDFVGTDASYAR